MKETRRRFSREFKLEAVRPLTTGRRLADVATAFPGHGRAPREEAELQRLRNEVAQLRELAPEKWTRS